MRYIFLIGRVLFSLIFIIKSFDHFSSKTVDYAASMGVPIAAFLVPFWGVVALLGGLSVLLGFKAKLGAWLIVIFLIPTTFYMHPYWDAKASFDAMMHHYCFWKNISMLGAALMISYTGSGPCSLSSK